MSIAYFLEDFKNYDYKPWKIKSMKKLFRGPRPDFEGKKYIVFLGAAQIFGRFAEKSLVDLYIEQTGNIALNLGIGGCGPDKLNRLFDQSSEFRNILENATELVIQLMAGKNSRCSQIDTHPNDLFSEKGSTDKPVFYENFLNSYFCKNGAIKFQELVTEMENNYIKDMLKFTQNFHCKKTLINMHRNRKYQRNISDVLVEGLSEEESLKNMLKFLRPFPALISSKVIDILSNSFDRVIDCNYAPYMPATIRKTVEDPDKVLREILEQQNSSSLVDWTKKFLANQGDQAGMVPAHRNQYYPSEEAHKYFAEQLIKYQVGLD